MSNVGTSLSLVISLTDSLRSVLYCLHYLILHVECSEGEL